MALPPREQRGAAFSIMPVASDRNRPAGNRGPSPQATASVDAVAMLA